MKKTIKSKQEFNNVFKNGKRVSTKLVRVSALTNEGDPGKVAFVAAKRLGCAPYRNKCKRLLRESARLCNLPKQDLSLILFATQTTYTSKPVDIANDLQQLVNKISHN